MLRLYPAPPGRGVRRGCVCLGSGFGCAPPRLAGVFGCVCVCRRALLVPRHSWLGCVVRAWVHLLGLRLRPATPGWGVGVCVCLCARSTCTPPLLAWPVGCVCAGVRALLVPRHSWLGCVVWVCVSGLWFWLRPATPGWGFGLCVCSCACPPCTPPFLAGVCGVGVCVWAWVWAAPGHSWLGCWGVRVCVRAPLVPRLSWLGCAVGVCVFGLGFRLHAATPGWGVWVCVFVCLLPLYPATPGRGARRGSVCLGSGLGCGPPLLPGALGCVCVCVRAPLVPLHSWLGCAVGVCVFGLGFRLHPATPGWAVGVCVCWCGRSACTLPLLAEVRAVGVCVWAQVSAAFHHSWLGCRGLCVLVWALRLHQATPGLGARRGCVCLGSGFRLHPATPGWGVGVCVCWCGRSACTPPLLAGVRAVGVCVWARVSAAPDHSWLGCWGVCVLVCVPPLYPATPGWGVRCGCVCFSSCFACAPPLLAGLWGCVCAGVRAPPVPRLSWLGCAAWVCVLGLGFRLRPATPGWGVGLCVC